MEKLIKISEGTDQSIQQLKQGLNDLSDKIDAGNNGQVDLISDYTVVAAKPNFAKLTTELSIEIVPKEYIEGTSATFYIDEKEVKLEAKDHKYVGKMEVSILKNYNKASVAFQKKSMITNATVTIDISFSDYFTRQSTLRFEGEKKYEAGEYSYDGYLIWNRTEEAFDTILYSRLVRAVDGKVQWSKELPITNLDGEQKFVFQQQFPIEALNSFELYIEQQSANGFTYRYFIDGGSLKDEDMFMSTEKENPCEVFDAEGNSLMLQK